MKWLKMIITSLSSNNVTKSPLPPINAPSIAGNATEVSIFKKGILVETETMEIGSKNIDRDICYIYDIPRKRARDLKEKFALASKRNASTSCQQVQKLSMV